MEHFSKRVGIVKDWDWPDIYRQTPNGDGIWEGIQFELQQAAQYDLVVVLNNRLEQPHTVKVKGRNLWALMQEPYAKGVTDWMAEKHEAFDKVFSNFRPNLSEKYIASQPAIPWHVNYTYSELDALAVPSKDRPLSWIVGNVKDLPGHMRRWKFLKALKAQTDIDVDLYGKAVRYIEHKNEGLLRYRYSLAIENTCTNDYWTEKIADCFLTWTVPIYFGCPNLEQYFPAKSFIRINIEDPLEAIKEIQNILEKDDWSSRLQAVAEARQLILKRYQLFPYLYQLINDFFDSSDEVRTVTVPAYRRSLKAYSHRRIYKIKKAFGFL